MSRSNTVYELKVTLRGFEDKIWRRVRIAASFTVAELGYTVIASMQIHAEYPFSVKLSGRTYCISGSCRLSSGDNDARDFEIAYSAPDIGDVFEISYGSEWIFDAEVCNIYEPEIDISDEMPEISEGMGRGIVSCCTFEEFTELVSATDASGDSVPIGINCQGRSYTWDYRGFDIIAQNRYMRDEYAYIKELYSEI